ncbi:MAG: metallophosphoesterase [Verrucomicrobiales bacterium]|nr:metallophosphoesterase [Verrucomicrobiales bacterium]
MKFRKFSAMLSLGFVFLGAAKIGAEELEAALDGTFTIIVIPDTQHYLGAATKATPDSKEALTNLVFDRWTDWIVENLDRQRIAFVSHVGDIVDINNREQWAFAKSMMDKLHGTIPYGLTVGNHDMKAIGDSSLFQEVFPKSRFAEFDWYGGCFEKASGDPTISGNNANSFQLFEVGALKFVILHLECNAPDDVLAWADSILEKFADRRAIITTHMDLGPREKPKTNEEYFSLPKGRMTWKKMHGSLGNTSQQMWDKCFRKHQNLFLICSGDQSRTQAYRLDSTGDHGNVVHALVSDYGSEGLRAMRFVPAENQIQVHTWDPIKGKLCESTKIVPDRNQHQFTLEYQMTP